MPTLLRIIEPSSLCAVGETIIYLKILTHQPDPQIVQDHLVPLLRPDYRDMPIDVWDLTTQQVLPYINGINHIARIAVESDVENALVKACIQNLVYYKVVSKTLEFSIVDSEIKGAFRRSNYCRC